MDIRCTRDQSSSPVEREVLERPLNEHQHSVSELHDLHDVNEFPNEPGEQPGEFDSETFATAAARPIPARLPLSKYSKAGGPPLRARRDQLHHPADAPVHASLLARLMPAIGASRMELTEFLKSHAMRGSSAAHSPLAERCFAQSRYCRRHDKNAIHEDSSHCSMLFHCLNRVPTFTELYPP